MIASTIRRASMPSALALVLLAGCGADKPATPRDDGKLSESALKEACHGAIKDRLKSPGTAAFGGEFLRESTTPELTGWVDSQNGFGALVRSTWVCTGTKTDVGWSVQVTLKQQ
jgi:hypothetical protein